MRAFCSALLLAITFGVSLPVPCAAADAQPDGAAAALALGQQGAAAFEAENHAEAIERFDRAFALLPAPSLKLWSARSCAKLGRLLEAQQRYRETSSLSEQVGDPAVQREAQRQARRELEQLAPRIPQLAVQVLGTAGQPADITLDGRAFDAASRQPTPVDPGHHVLVGSFRGQRVTLAAELAEGERRELVLEFSVPSATVLAPAFDSDASAPPPSGSAKAWRTAGWVGIGAGGALLLTGILTGVAAQSRYDDLQREPGCSRTQCPPEASERIDSYNSLRSVSLWTTLGGAVIAAAGGGVLLLAPGDAESGVALVPGGVTWSGRF